jgi:quinol monooxygenase YgiN
MGLLFMSLLPVTKKLKNMNYSVEIIRYTIASGNHASFEKAWTDAAKYLQSSKYCLGYQVVHGKEEPDHYIVTIHWTSIEEHLNGFRKSPDFMAFFTLVKPFINNIEEMKHYELTPIAGGSFVTVAK